MKMLLSLTVWLKDQALSAIHIMIYTIDVYLLLSIVLSITYMLKLEI